MTTQTLTRDEVRETAIRALVTHEKMLRAGMTTGADLLTTVQPALDAAHTAGWTADDIHPAADRRYARWLIKGADREEQGIHATTIEALVATHRATIGSILGHDIPADTSPITFMQHLQDAAHALPDSPEWAYDRAVLDVAAYYLTDAQTADHDPAGLYRAADEALAALDIAT